MNNLAIVIQAVEVGIASEDFAVGRLDEVRIARSASGRRAFQYLKRRFICATRSTTIDES